MPAALSWTEVGRTTTAMARPRTSSASPRSTPDTFLLTFSPVVVLGTPAAARMDWVSMITRDGLVGGLPAAQEFLNPLVQTVLVSQREVVEHHRPGRQIAPLTPGPVLVEDCVHDLPEITRTRVTGSLRAR